MNIEIAHCRFSEIGEMVVNRKLTVNVVWKRRMRKWKYGIGVYTKQPVCWFMSIQFHFACYQISYSKSPRTIFVRGKQGNSENSIKLSILSLNKQFKTIS